MAKRDFIDVDPDRLPDEWVAQPRLMFEASQAVADAEHDRNQEKVKLDVVEAELALQIRRNPEAFQLPEKPTEAAYKAAIQIHPKYQKQLATVLEAEHKLDILQARVAALTDKRRALERLVELAAIDYYAEPRARTDDARTVSAEFTKREARKPTRRRPDDD